MYIYPCTGFILYNAYRLVITTWGDGNRTEEVTNLAIFTVEVDTRFAKCNKCEIKVPCRGQSAKVFIPMNLVHHLKTNPRHKEEYEKYLKKENDKKTESSVIATSDGMRLRQVSLQGTVELRKIWDINDSRAKSPLESWRNDSYWLSTCFHRWPRRI